jgi:hypothetical protein
MSLKSLLRFPIDYPRAKRLIAQGKSGEMPTNFVRFKEQRKIASQIGLRLFSESMLVDAGRHLASIAISAQKTGHGVVLVCNRRLVAAIARKRYGGLFLSMPNVDWVEASKPESAITYEVELTDDPLACHHSAIEIRMGRDVESGVSVMPYPSYPIVAQQADDVTLDQLRARPRTARLFFGGNLKPSYGSGKIGRNFDLMSRIEVIDTVSLSFASRIVPTFAQANSEHCVVISDSRSHPIEINDWLPSMASSDFFLCPPGNSQPLCHNFAEAISVGTIPILEYGDRIRPNLVDGQNAIFFCGPGGLLSAVARVLSMSDKEIRSLRRGVIDFYDNHYRHEDFIASLFTRRPQRNRICMPFHECNLYHSMSEAA